MDRGCSAAAPGAVWSPERAGLEADPGMGLGGGNECCWLLIASTRQHLSDPAVAALTLPSFLPPQERLLPLRRGEGSIPSSQDAGVC